jgi:hypothetical protein
MSKEEYLLDTILSIATEPKKTKRKEQHCIVCSKELPKYKTKFCSDECRYQRSLEDYKSPIKEQTGHHNVPLETTQDSMAGIASVKVPPEILSLAEINEDNHLLVEDTEEIMKITYEELSKHASARYKLQKEQRDAKNNKNGVKHKSRWGL